MHTTRQDEGPALVGHIYFPLFPILAVTGYTFCVHLHRLSGYIDLLINKFINRASLQLQLNSELCLSDSHRVGCGGAIAAV